jgi:integrase
MPSYFYDRKRGNTDIRISELYSLRWSDIDLLLCQLSVTRTLHHLRDGSMVLREPKTEKGYQLIALTPSTVSVLKKYKGKQLVQRITAGTSLKEDDLVSSQGDGRPLLPGTVSHAWIHLIQHSKLKNIRLHDAMHSHATLMLKQKVQPEDLQELLGHASIKIILDTYSHVAPGLQKTAERFDEALKLN